MAVDKHYYFDCDSGCGCGGSGCGCGGSGCGCGGSCCSPGCDGMNLSALCVIYQGVDLDTLGVKQGARLEGILKNIDDLVSRSKTLNAGGIASVNRGKGVELYKGLNSDAVGEMRTFRTSRSIQPKNDDDTIEFDISDTWIEATIKPLSDSIVDLQAESVKFQTQWSMLQGNVATNTGSISKLFTSVSNLELGVQSQDNTVGKVQDEIKELQEDFYVSTEAVKLLRSNTEQGKEAILALKSQVDNIEDSVTYVEEFQGQLIIPLAHPVDEILNIYYEGAVLPKVGWVYQEPNQVALQLGVFGIQVDPMDIIRVEYKSFKNKK